MAALSKRTSWETAESGFSLHAAAERRRRGDAGERWHDLTVANPTSCGFVYDERALLAPLAQPQALHYVPEPFGMTAARRAVAAYYADHGAVVSTEDICLTTSTSEAYSFLFRLLCDPGDEVLVASPSYPLFDFIARLDGVRLVGYPLLYHDGWLTDLHALEQAITERTRAVIVVYPNNPTGHFCSAEERGALQELCCRRGLALIVDEVFLDYPLGPPAPSFLAEHCPALTFVLSGISKVCGLPQMKCSWMAAAGPEPLRADALARLEIVADTFLSMNAPVQHALSHWLAARGDLQTQIIQRIRRNWAHAEQALSATQASILATEAGWTCVVRVPRTVGRIPFCEALLARGVLVQPGDFYGLSDGRIVLSLLTPAAAWDAGIAVLAELAAG